MQQQLLEKVRERADGKPKGGTRLETLIGRAEQAGRLTLFVPWAAPVGGRAELSREPETIAWLADTAQVFGAVVLVRLVMMPADSYAERNGFDMSRSGRYWKTVEVAARAALAGAAEFVQLAASVVERQPEYQTYLAKNAYALERLNPKTAAKIIEAASRYAGLSSQAAYEDAGRYAMTRAAEADYASNELGALWVSLNYPERDAMCGDTPGCMRRSGCGYRGLERCRRDGGGTEGAD